MQSSQFLTIADIAAELGVERHFAGQLVRQMPCVVVGRLKRVRRTEFERWLQAHTLQEAEEPKAPTRKAARNAFNPNLFEPDGGLKRRRA